MSNETIVISSGSVESGLVIGFGTSLVVESGGTALDATILAGGGLVVENGGVASETTLGPVTSGIVSSGGVIIDTVVQSAAVLTISSGGTDSVTSVASGGTLYAWGTNSGITAASGAILHETVYVSSGEMLSGLTVTSGIDILVASGGTVVSADVQSGGEIDLGGGVVSGAIVEAQGEFRVDSGTAISTTLAGGQMDVSGPGTASATTVGAGATLFGSGTTLVGTTVESGGLLLALNSTVSDTRSEPGATVDIRTYISSGQVVSDMTVDSAYTLTVSSGASAATITVSSSGHLTIANGATATGVVLEDGASADVTGVVHGIVVGGRLDLSSPPAIPNASPMEIDNLTIVGGGLVFSNPNDVVNNLTIGGSGTFFNHGILSGSVIFTDHGTLDVVSDTVGVTISGFGDGNSLHLEQLTYVPGAFAVGEPGQVVIVEGGQTTVISMAGDYTNAHFSVAQDVTDRGTLITVSNAPCFVSGTRIETEDGARPVETLAVGDRVRRLDGSLAPVIWIGSRMVECRRHPAPEAVRPIRIAAGAFAEGVPSRPLLLSPDHAVWSEGVLIPVKHLVNGTSIRQMPAETVQYFHVELEEHAVIFAEDLAVESYLDTGDRSAFLAAEGATALHPVWGRDRPDAVLTSEALAYAPLRVTGPEIARLRAHLAGRAALAGARRVAP
ncbi:Hint domain-containing protein [Acidisoma sp. 7E03]